MNSTNITHETTVDIKAHSKHIIALLLAVIIMMSVFICLQHQKHELEEQEAYLLSAVITLQEDNLFLAYGLFPEDVGLEALKDAWTSTPCCETATRYSNALAEVLEKLEENSSPSSQPVDKNFV